MAELVEINVSIMFFLKLPENKDEGGLLCVLLTIWLKNMRHICTNRNILGLLFKGHLWVSDKRLPCHAEGPHLITSHRMLP